MAKAFLLEGDVVINAEGAKGQLRDLEKMQTRVPVSMNTLPAQREAQSFIRVANSMERNVIRPRVDTGSIKQATTEVTKLDKAWASIQRNAKSAAAGAKTTATASTSGRGVSAGALSLGSLWAGGAGAFAGVVGAQTIGRAMTSSITGAIDTAKLESFMGRAFGTAGEQFVQTAKELSSATGFMADDLMRATLVAKSLSVNYGLQADQVAKLVQVSTDLAATSPYEDIDTTTEAMSRLEAAVRGEAESSERLGLTLNDTYMKNVAFGGSLKDTWEKLSDAEKAQYRYAEILNQTKDILGAAEEEGLSKNLRETEANFKKAGQAIAEKLLPALTKLLEVLAKVPTGAWEIGAGAGGALTTVLLAKGMISIIRSLIGTVGKRGASAGLLAELGLLGGGGGGALVNTLAGAVTAGVKALLPAVATLAPAIPVVVGAGIAAHAYTEYETQQFKLREQTEEQEFLRRRYMQQLSQGIDWGVYISDNKKFVQGTPVGWDVPAQEPIYVTRNIGGKLQQYIAGYKESTTINRWGYPLGSAYSGAMSEPRQEVQVDVTINNQSDQPLKVQDARSYSPSNY